MKCKSRHNTAVAYIRSLMSYAKLRAYVNTWDAKFIAHIHTKYTSQAANMSLNAGNSVAVGTKMQVICDWYCVVPILLLVKSKLTMLLFES